MRVDELMAREVRACAPDDTLNGAARIMWEADCGCVPVVREGRLVGMITDRDVCMAAYTRGRSLHEVRVREAMSRAVRTCRPDDEVDTALETLREAKVRRLPVVDDRCRLVGLFSLSDAARAIAALRTLRARRHAAEQLAATLAAVCEPRKLSAPHPEPPGGPRPLPSVGAGSAAAPALHALSAGRASG
jgi:CBS domain-containing protein